MKGPLVMLSVQIPNAVPRFLGGYISFMYAAPRDNGAHTPRPWKIRATMMLAYDLDTATPQVAIRHSESESSRIGLRPNRSASGFQSKTPNPIINV